MKRWRRRHNRVATEALAAASVATEALRELEATQERIGRDIVRATQNRYGGERFDAVGLFVQWLCEQTHRTEPNLGFSLRLYSISGGSHIVFEVYREGPWFSKQWAVAHLNRLLEADGRGHRLRDEIADTMRELKEMMES